MSIHKQCNRDSCRKGKEDKVPVPLTAVQKRTVWGGVPWMQGGEKPHWLKCPARMHIFYFPETKCACVIRPIVCVCVIRPIVFPARLCQYLLYSMHKTPHCICHQIGQDPSSSSHLVSGCPSAEGCNSETTLHSYKWHHSLWLYNALGGSLFLWAFTA